MATGVLLVGAAAVVSVYEVRHTSGASVHDGPRLLTGASEPYGRTMPDASGEPVAMQGLLPVCTDGGPVTVTDVRPLAGDLLVTGWTVLPAASRGEYDGRSFADGRPAQVDEIRSRCGGVDGEAVPDTQAFDDILIEVRRPGEGDAELRGIEVTYRSGVDEGAVRYPLTAALCGGQGEDPLPECAALGD